MKTYTIQCLSEAVSPISHASGTAGNESIVARETVFTSRGPVVVPFISGNAFRHRAIRRPAAAWIVDRYGLKGKLSLDQLNLLFHGGNLTESNAHENTKRIAEMHRTWPMLRLLGGCLPDQILAGAMDSWRGVMVCEENRDTLAMTLGNIPEARLSSCEQFATSYQYTRGDAAKTGLSNEPRNDLPSNLMIYSGQAVARGALFHHGFVLKHVNTLELGCLLLSLRLWQAEGGTVGGNARLGHGRLKLRLIDFIDDDEAVNEYVAHVDAVRDDAIAWLNDSFTPKAELRERKKAAKKSAKSGEVVSVADEGE